MNQQPSCDVREQENENTQVMKWPFSFNEDWDGWGWSVFFGQLAIAFGLLIFGLAHFAFASRQVGSYSFTTEQTIQPTHLQIQGSLTWKNGVAEIADGATGAVYRLSDQEEVRSLYGQGVRKVSVSGTLSDPDTESATIQVESMAAVR